MTSRRRHGDADVGAESCSRTRRGVGGTPTARRPFQTVSATRKAGSASATRISLPGQPSTRPVSESRRRLVVLTSTVRTPFPEVAATRRVSVDATFL